jgi:YbbR domain-containing protein
MRGLFDNLALKLVSLALAGLLWFVIAGEKTSEMGVSAHVELQNFPKDLEVTGEPVDVIEVRLRASPGIIQRIAPGDVSAQVDLAGMLEGEHIIHLTERSIRLPFGVNVVKITPSILTLDLERTLQKVVPIHPRILGRPAPGYEVGEVTAEPAEVRIAGPKSRVHEVESAFTEAVSVEGAENNVVDVVNMGLEDPLLRIQGSPRVRVAVRIQEVQHRRTLDVPVAAPEGASGVRPATVRVLVEGPASLVKTLEPLAVRAVAGAPAGRGGEAEVQVVLPASHAGLTVLEVTPSEVVVRPARLPRKAS